MVFKLEGKRAGRRRGLQLDICVRGKDRINKTI
jgi:hypothetical protein